MYFKRTLLAAAVAISLGACSDNDNDDDNNGSAAEKNFNRVSSFLVCSLTETNCDTDTETAAEIVAASEDGNTLVFSDSPAEQLGFVDITDPSAPSGIGTLALTGEPTSVAVSGNYALVGLNTSADFVNTSGSLVIVNMTTRTQVHSIDLGGQPDSVAVSPDGNYAIVAIENERDEDLGTGNIADTAQLPAGTVAVIDISDADPTNWAKAYTDPDLTMLTGMKAPTDPEPEYVDINSDNIAVVTMQENNHLALIDLATGNVTAHFTAGSVNLTEIDTEEEEPAIIDLSSSQNNVVREPDGVAWIGTDYFATADEGDMDGGSRGFTIFSADGTVAYTSGNTLDHMTVRFGHYPDSRSGNKGNEPENIEVGTFGDDTFLFVNSERSSLTFVYNVNNPDNPVYKQTLPAGAGPEGGLAIPSRNLLVTASEEDNRGDKLRSVLNIYQYAEGEATYPTIESVDVNGLPIAWSAMSGLSADPTDSDILYAVEDSFYGSNRIFTIDISETPASLTSAMMIMDSNDVFAAISAVSVTVGTEDDDATRIDVFDTEDLALLINDDKSVNIDPEGVAKASDGGFWIASEGSGTVGDADRPVNSLNFLFKTDANGVIEQVITLPDAVNDDQLRFGFEGVTEYNDNVYVAFQRAWPSDTNVRIGIYDTTAESWSFLFYELDAAESQNGGWVGLSDMTSLGNGSFLVVERDNQGGPDAAIKRLYRFDTTGLAANSTVTKTLVRDLITSGDLTSTGGLTPEKVEGSAVMSNGDVYIINDNDGVDDNSGETRLINLGDIL